MKTYKLKKDLQLAKTGEEVEIYEKGQNIVRIYKKPNNNRSGILICQIKKEDFNEWLEEIPQKPKSVWDLKEGEHFYMIFKNDVFEISIKDYKQFEKYYLEEGNVFLTEAEARKELDKRKAAQGLKKYCFDNNISLSDRRDRNSHYFSLEYFHGNDDGFTWDWTHSNANIIGYFKTMDDARQVVKNCEEDLKIIFNI